MQNTCGAFFNSVSIVGAKTREINFPTPGGGVTVSGHLSQAAPLLFRCSISVLCKNNLYPRHPRLSEPAGYKSLRLDPGICTSAEHRFRSVDMKLIVAVLVVAIFLPDVEGRRSLLFQTATATDMVEMFPAKPLELHAFTLCLRFATELSGKRDIILFAYRTGGDELNVWREQDGRLSFYLSGDGVFFTVPDLGPLENHLCFTWTNLMGLATLYVNGRSSVAKIYKKGHVVRPGGRIILGQDADSLLGDFEEKQSFVGQISEVNLWDYVLLPQFIQDMVSGRRVPLPNVLDWRTVKLSPVGNVVVIDDDGTV